MATFREFFHFLIPSSGMNRSLRILITLNMLFTFVVSLFAPFYAVYVVKIGGDIAFAGLSWAVFGIISGVLTLLFTRWELRVKEQELLLALGYLIRAGVFLSYAFMTSMAQLLLTQVLWGVAVAIGVPAFFAVYSEHTTKEKSIAEWGGLEGVTSIATGVAALVGGYVISLFGFTPIFFGMAAISAGLAVYIWILPRDVL